MGTILKNGINYSGSGGGGGGVSSYNELTDKPSINNVSLTGNKSLSDLGIASSDTSYSSGDTAESTLADGDYFPFYDTSASGKRKTLWSNIKSVLKTYFDTFYSTVKTRGTATSGGTALSLVNTGDLYNINQATKAARAFAFSSSEQEVGTFNGKVVYQKTITGTTPSSTNTWSTYATNTTLASVLYIVGTVTTSAGNVFALDTNDGITNGRIAACAILKNASSNPNKVALKTYSDGYCNCSFIMTIRYTKT